MLDREVKLLLACKPITPFLLKGNNVGWESTLSQLNSLAVSVALHIRVKSSVEDIHLLVEVTGLFVHARLNELGSNLVKLIVRDRNVVCRHTISCLGWETSLKVQLDSGNIVTFALLDLSCLSFLVSFQEPLEVVILELSDVLMLELLGDLDRLVPSVQLLVHGHSFFDLIVLN